MCRVLVDYEMTGQRALLHVVSCLCVDFRAEWISRVSRGSGGML